MSGIPTLASRLRGAAARVDDEAPLPTDESAALRIVLEALPADLAAEDETRVLRDAARAPRRRFVGGLSAAAAVLMGISIWLLVAPRDRNGEHPQVALRGPSLEVEITPPPVQAFTPGAERAPKEDLGDAVFDLGSSRVGEIHITPEEDCAVFVTLLGAESEVILPVPDGGAAERTLSGGLKQYFGFAVPEGTETGTFLILARRERRGLEQLYRSVAETVGREEKDNEETVARIVERLRTHADLSVTTARFRRTRE